MTDEAGNLMGAASPTPAEIRQARKAAGLTQSQAAAMVCRTLRNWQQWEGGERRMSPALWRLFLLMRTRKLGAD